MSPFAKRFVLFIGAVMVALIGVGWFSTKIQDKPYGVHDLERAKWDRMQAEIKQREEDLEKLRTGKQEFPKVEVSKMHHTFGTQVPFSSSQQAFTFSNSGTADLLLTVGAAKGNSISANVPSVPIPPGGDGTVIVGWQIDEQIGPYEEEISIQTNDPRRPIVRLKVSGVVPAIVALEHTIFNAPRVEPDKLVSVSNVLFSQVWNDFEIQDIECGLETFQWSAEPISEQECRAANCLSAYRVNVSVSRSSKGSFSEPMRIKVVPRDDAWRPADVDRSLEHPFGRAIAEGAPLELTSSFEGRVIARINFYGENLHQTEGLEIGLVECGRRYEFPLTVRVRGNNVPDRLEVLEVQPPELQGRIEAVAGQKGVFRLIVIVPAEAKPVVFNADQKHGFINVGDPENPELSNWFPIMGAIAEPPPGESIRSANR